MQFLPRNINASAWAAALESRLPWLSMWFQEPCDPFLQFFFPIKIDPKSQKIGNEIPLMYEAARFPDQETRKPSGDQKEMLPLQETSPTT